MLPHISLSVHVSAFSVSVLSVLSVVQSYLHSLSHPNPAFSVVHLTFFGTTREDSSRDLTVSLRVEQE
jgi:hypothetical protein